MASLASNFSGAQAFGAPDGIAVGSVSWQVVRKIANDSIALDGTRVTGGDLTFAGNTARITPLTDMAAVLTRTGVTFVHEDKEVGLVSLIGEDDRSYDLDGTYLTGYKVQPLVYSTDLSRTYIAGKGKIYVVDMLTYRLI